MSSNLTRLAKSGVVVEHRTYKTVVEEVRSSFSREYVALMLIEKVPADMQLPGSPRLMLEVEGNTIVLVQRHEKAEYPGRPFVDPATGQPPTVAPAGKVRLRHVEEL